MKDKLTGAIQEFQEGIELFAKFELLHNIVKMAETMSHHELVVNIRNEYDLLTKKIIENGRNK